MHRLPLILVATFLFVSGPVLAAEGGIATFWPLFDYRSSTADDYASLTLLGPLVKYESGRRFSRFALRPLFFHQASRDGVTVEEDYLYPVSTRLRDGEQHSFQLFHLLNYDFGPRETGSRNEFSLYPLIFSGRTPEAERYFAFFPLGGRLLHKFGRDSIDFVLFPLYSRTVDAGTVTHNVLWPVISSSHGPTTSGWQFWPVYGEMEKAGVYDKRFVAWPFYIANDVALDTPEPIRQRLSFPLYESIDSPSYRSRTWLWPFFNHIEDENRGYEEWDFPWPLLRRSVGEYRHGVRVFPLFTDETVGANRKRLFLWPLYKIEESHTDILSRRRDRILYFLYSDLEERVRNEPLPRKKRIALWPLFTYENREGASSFATLALLEPFYPENERIARNLAPLWHVYQTRWDRQGNRASSLLWNLYWKERRGADLAWELFPLVAYSHETTVGSDLRVLKGLFHYQSGAGQRSLKLFFLPWGVRWDATSMAESRQ